MATLNQQVRSLVTVTDLVGVAVTGLVTGNFTIDLQRESNGDLVAAAEIVTVEEEGGGLYWVDFTPTAAAGLYFLTISHATNTVNPDSFQVTAFGPGTVAGPYLTTLDRVKEQLFAGDSTPPTTHDSLINTIIAEVTARIRAMLGNRLFTEQAFIDYADGIGTTKLFLRQGPLVSITRIDEVVYSDDGGGNRQEDLTQIAEPEFVPRGLGTEGYLGKGWVERLSAVWVPGQRNYKVTYVAGFDPLPEFLVEAATKEVLNEVRHDPAVSMLKIGDYEIRTPLLKDRDLALSRALSPLRDYSVG